MVTTNSVGLTKGGSRSRGGGSNEAQPWLGRGGVGKARLGHVRGLAAGLVALGCVDWYAWLALKER